MIQKFYFCKKLMRTRCLQATDVVSIERASTVDLFFELVHPVPSWRVSPGCPNAHAVRRLRNTGSFGVLPDVLGKVAAVLELAGVRPELACRTLSLAVLFEAIIVILKVPVDIFALNGLKKKYLP